MKRKYDMVFCDLDGTLLDHTHRQIPQINQRAIQRAIALDKKNSAIFFMLFNLRM